MLSNKEFVKQIVRIYTVCKENNLFSWRYRDRIILQMVENRKDEKEYNGKLDIQD